MTDHDTGGDLRCPEAADGPRGRRKQLARAMVAGATVGLGLVILATA